MQSSTTKLSSFKQACTLIGADANTAAADNAGLAEKAHIIFLAACKLLGIDPGALPILSMIDPEFQSAQIALYKLQVINKAVVGNWKADPNNRRQLKWEPLYWLDSPGVRFSGAFGWNAYAYAGLGSRLAFETEAQAVFIGKDCIWFYCDLYAGGALAPA